MEVLMSAPVVLPVGLVLSILMGMNLWFIKSLVNDVRRIPHMSDKIEILERQLAELSRDFKDINHLRERVAVLEALLKKSRRRGSHADA